MRQKKSVRLHFYLVTLCLIAVSFLNSTNSIAKRFRKILVIDSVLGTREHFFVSLYSPSLDTGFGRRFNFLGVRLVDTVTAKGNGPIVATVESDDAASSILIAIDDAGGYVRLKNWQLLGGDTIRILRLQILQNCIPDTIKTDVSWYRKRSGKRRLRLLKKEPTKVNSVIAKNCNASLPQTITLTINNRQYAGNLRLIQHPLSARSWYHGHKQMSESELEQYEERKYNGRSYEYFAAMRQTVKMISSVEIVL